MSRATSRMHLVTYPVSVALPQLLGLIALSAIEFGHFSLVYLSYAFAVSILLSVVSEPYARAAEELRVEVAASYQAVAGAVSMLATIVTLACSIAAGIGWVNTTLALVAVFFASVWTSIRYRLVHIGAAQRVFMVEAVGITGVIVFVAIVAVLGNLALWTVLFVWLLHNVVCLVGTGSFAAPSIRRLVWWIGRLRQHIRPLLSESIIQDAGAIGVPFLIAPFLGPAAFGRYRAISNIAFPVRLSMSAVRPMLARKPIECLLSTRWVLAATAVFSLSGLAAGTILAVLPRHVDFGGVVLELDRYAIACGLFVLSNGLNFYFYFVCRIYASGAELFRHRMAQTVLVIVAPVGGLVFKGEEGAVWGFVCAALLSVPVWYRCARRAGPR